MPVRSAEKQRHMLMKVCAERGEGHGVASLRAHSESVERSLEWIGDEGASQAGDALSLSHPFSFSSLFPLSLSLSLFHSGCFSAEVSASR